MRLKLEDNATSPRVVQGYKRMGWRDLERERNKRGNW